MRETTGSYAFDPAGPSGWTTPPGDWVQAQVPGRGPSSRQGARAAVDLRTRWVDVTQSMKVAKMTTPATNVAWQTREMRKTGGGV